MVRATATALKSYYKSELDYLRTRAREFSQEYPLIAESLQLSDGRSADPHIEMLLQSFAFLTGRLHHRLEAEIPQVSNQLLHNLYPHLAAPIPSMAVVQATVKPSGTNFSNGYRLKRGRLISIEGRDESGGSAICTASLCYDTDLWPLQIVNVNSEPTNYHEFLAGNTEVRSVLKVRIRATCSDPIHDLPIKSLRFYIDGDEQQVGALFTLLTNRLRGVAVLNDKHEIIELDRANVEPQGYDNDQAALPFNQQTHQGYRILQEYFSFPEKFLFVDLIGLDGIEADQQFDLLLLLDRPIEKGLVLDQTVLKLNCVPVVNLFEKTTDPIRVDKTQTEYRLIPDTGQYRHCEIHSVNDVVAVNVDGKARIIAPYFAMAENDAADSRGEFWSLRREASQFASLPGSEVYLSFFDANDQPDTPAEDSIYAKALCCNRKLMENIRSGSRFELNGGGPVDGMTLITRPSRHQLPPLQGEMPWDLISQLTINHLSLVEGVREPKSLKKILSLHAGEHRLVNQRQIDSICEMKVRRIARRIGNDAWRGFCPGLEITLTIDEDLFQGGGCLLFGEVLSRFFALYASINSFTELVFESKKQSDDQVKRWRAMAGEQALV